MFTKGCDQYEWPYDAEVDKSIHEVPIPGLSAVPAHDVTRIQRGRSLAHMVELPPAAPNTL